MNSYPTGGINPIEQQELLKEIGGEILDFQPQKGERLVYEDMAVAGYGSSRLTAIHGDGTSERIGSPVSIIETCEKLRHGMYQEGKGTWFSMTYTITRPSSFTVEFNYDEQPKFQFAPDPELYVEDLKRFPRNPEHIPEWLQEKLREAEQE